MSKRRSLLVQGSVVCSLGLAGCITPVDVPPTPSLPSSPGSHYWSSKTTTFGPSFLFSGNEGIAPEAAVEKNNNPSMPNKESAVLSEKEKEELAYASARLAAPYFCFVERTLTDALIVNVKDKYVSIDEVLAEAEKFDTNDSIAREMSNLALSKLQTLRDYLVHAGDTSGFPAGTYDVHDGIRRETLALMQSLQKKSNPLANLLIGMLEDFSYVTVDVYTKTSFKDGFFRRYYAERDDSVRQRWVNRHYPCSGKLVSEQLLGGAK